MDRDLFDSDTDSESFDSADDFSDTSPLQDVQPQPMGTTEKWDVFQVIPGCIVAARIVLESKA